MKVTRIHKVRQLELPPELSLEQYAELDLAERLIAIISHATYLDARDGATIKKYYGLVALIEMEIESEGGRGDG